MLAVFSKNSDIAELTERLHRSAPNGVVVAVLSRHSEQIESVIRDVNGALVFER